MRSQDMPADHAAAYAFVLRRANILYACGKSVSAGLLEGSLGCCLGSFRWAAEPRCWQPCSRGCCQVNDHGLSCCARRCCPPMRRMRSWMSRCPCSAQRCARWTLSTARSGLEAPVLHPVGIPCCGTCLHQSMVAAVLSYAP